MRWSSRGKSSDIEDRRGESPGGGFGGGGFRRVAPIGLGGVAILFVLSLVTGQNFLSILDDTADPSAPPTTGSATPPADDPAMDLVSFVLDDAQDTWQSILGARYQRAHLVTFTDAVESACGMAESATGPFYCPGDQKVYIDLGFYRELKERFGAPGEFAQAYVLAHELGHHVQRLTGIEAQVRQAQRNDPRRANGLSVAMELQADCYAGIWGHSTAQRDILEKGDVEDGLNAAASIGDDRIQRMSGRRVAPEQFTHGSSADRVTWFKRGLESGRMESCDTFGGR